MTLGIRIVATELALAIKAAALATQAHFRRTSAYTDMLGVLTDPRGLGSGAFIDALMHWKMLWADKFEDVAFTTAARD